MTLEKMGGTTRMWILSFTFALFLKECSSAGGSLPLGIILAPLGQRCIHEEVAAGTEAVVELFVEKGAKLEVHLTIEGPMTKAWGNVPEANEKTVKLLDEVVTNGHEEDFDDSFLFTFESKGGDNGNVYQVCVSNDMNHLISKTVQLDIRTNYGPRKSEPKRVKLVQNPDQLTEEERVAAKAKEEEVANLEASIKRLKAGLRKVFRQQQQERHRQAVHTAVNEDSNNHMVVGSLIETVVFIGAACFQLIFIRKWFDGKVGGKGRQWA